MVSVSEEPCSEIHAIEKINNLSRSFVYFDLRRRLLGERRSIVVVVQFSLAVCRFNDQDLNSGNNRFSTSRPIFDLPTKQLRALSRTIRQRIDPAMQ